MGVKPARGGDRSLQIGTVIGVAAAVVLAVLLNVIGARHFRRWDATSEGLYTGDGALNPQQFDRSFCTHDDPAHVKSNAFRGRRR